MLGQDIDLAHGDDRVSPAELLPTELLCTLDWKNFWTYTGRIHGDSTKSE